MHGHHGFGHGGTHYGGHHHHNDIGDGLTLVGDLLGLNVYPKNCPHRNDGFGFGHQSAHNSGTHGGHAFRRHCDPPRYGYHGYYYNYPGLVIGTAIIGTAALTSTMQPRHVVYVSQKQQVPNLNSNVNVRHYYVIVPENIYPGETFRAVLGNEEVLITCPEISGPGEKIMVTTEQPPMEPIVVNGVPVTVDVNKPVQAVEIINSGYTHDNIHYPSTIYVNNNSNTSVPSAPPAIVIPTLPTNDNNSGNNSSNSSNNKNNDSGGNSNNNGGVNSSFGPYFTTGNNKNSSNNNQNIYNTYPPAATPAPFNPAYVGDITQPSANNSSNNSGNNNSGSINGYSGNGGSNNNNNNDTNSNNTSVINGNVVYSACGTYIPNNNTNANTNLTINNNSINNSNNINNNINSSTGNSSSPRTPNIYAGITSQHQSANISAIPAPSVSAVARNGKMTGTATAAVLSAVGSGGGKATGGTNLTGDVTSCPKCTFYNPSFASVCKGCNAPINHN